MKAESKYKGAIKLAAIGDALGWITEFESSQIGLQSKYGLSRIEKFIEWSKNVGGRFNGYNDNIDEGSYSDDTQLLLAVARSIRSNGRVDNQYFSKVELPNWLYYSRGAGRTIKNAAAKMERKSTKWNTNFFNFRIRDEIVDYRDCGANGAAMRILPIVLANFNDKEKIKHEVFANSIITHGHSRAILGALLLAYAIDQILPITPDDFDPESFIVQIGQDFLKKFELTFLTDPNLLEWINQWNSGSNIKFQEQYHQTLVETQEYLRLVYKALVNNQEIGEVLNVLGCVKKETKSSGISTVLAGIFISCKFYREPLEGILFAVNFYGSDTDSIAAFSGALLGALHGQSIIPEKWKKVQDFEYLDKIAIDLLSISEELFEEKKIESVNETNYLDFNLEKHVVGDRVFFKPLGEGIVTKVDHQKPLTKGKYNIILDVQFAIGQTCRFNKLVGGEIPLVQFPLDLKELISNRIQISNQELLIKFLQQRNDQELNEIFKIILNSII